MTKIETKTVKLSEIKLNKNNPRTITGKKMDLLVKSLVEFPEMLDLREIVVDETMMVLGGNMRVLALRKIGSEDCMAKIVSGLTPEQKREFVIKDNANFGEWDMDTLANSWDDLPLTDWGIDIPTDWGSPTTENGDNDMIPDKDPNILVRLSFHPGLWLGKREEIMGVLDKMIKTYECTIKVEE